MKPKTRIIATCIFGLFGLGAALLGSTFYSISLHPLSLIFFPFLIPFCLSCFLYPRNFSHNFWGLFSGLSIALPLALGINILFSKFISNRFQEIFHKNEFILGLACLIFFTVHWFFIRKLKPFEKINSILDRGLFITLLSMIIYPSLVPLIELYFGTERFPVGPFDYEIIPVFMILFCFICIPLGILASFSAHFILRKIK